MKRSAMFLICLIFSIQAFAWVQSTNTTIKEFIQWEASDGSGYAVMILQTGVICHLPLKEKELYSFILSLYMAKKTFSVHCHDQELNIGGYPSHKLHRINAT